MYVIKEPRNCLLNPPDRIEICDTYVFPPILKPYVKIPAFRCYLLTERFSSVFYFFGSKTKEMQPSVMQPVNQDRCLRASKSGRDVELGKLEPIGEDTYQTIHKLEIRYK